MAFCTQADLEIALGGASELVQLADRDQDGVADPAVVTDYLESGAAAVRKAVEVKHEPETIAALDADSLRFLRDLNKWWSAAIAWLEGGKGQALPDRLREQREWVQHELDRIRTGEARLGRVAGGKSAALGQFVGNVDHDPCRNGISVASLRKYGFR